MRQFNFSSFDQVFDLFDEILDSTDFVSRLPTVIVNQGYPPSNIFTNKDGRFVIELAVAGWKQEELSIDYEDHYLKVTLNPLDSDNENRYIQKGIKRSKTDFKVLIPKKYDERSIDAQYSNGLLTISLSVKEEAKPVKVDIKTS